MILEPADVESIIVDLYLFCLENPRQKLPMRYISILSKILTAQLSEHPAVADDDMQHITAITPPEDPWQPQPQNKHTCCTKKPAQTPEKYN